MDMDASLAGRIHATREQDRGATAAAPLSEVAMSRYYTSSPAHSLPLN
jgi:hypothetical protein